MILNSPSTNCSFGFFQSSHPGLGNGSYLWYRTMAKLIRYKVRRLKLSTSSRVSSDKVDSCMLPFHLFQILMHKIIHSPPLSTSLPMSLKEPLQMSIQPLNILLTITRPASPMAPNRWKHLQLPNTRFHIRDFVF